MVRMGETVEAGRLLAALETWRGYLDDLLRVDLDGASTKLRLVVSYAAREPLLRPLVERLRARFPREDFFARLGASDLGIPAGGPDRLAFLHDLLVHLKRGERITLRELLTSRELFGGGGLEERWERFRALVVAPLKEDVEALCERLRGRARDAEVDAEAFFSGALAEGSTAEAMRGDEAAGEEGASLNALRAAIRRAGLGVAEDDLLTDVDLLSVELRKHEPSADRLAELVEGFRAVSSDLGDAAGACLPPSDRPSTQGAVESGAGPSGAVCGGPGGAAPNEARAGGAVPGHRAQPALGGAEREAIAAERAALAAERAALAAEREALQAEREALQAERRALRAEREAGGGPRRGAEGAD